MYISARQINIYRMNINDGALKMKDKERLQNRQLIKVQAEHQTQNKNIS